jgi:hypothetical protein
MSTGQYVWRHPTLFMASRRTRVFRAEPDPSSIRLAGRLAAWQMSEERVWRISRSQRVG